MRRIRLGDGTHVPCAYQRLEEFAERLDHRALEAQVAIAHLLVTHQQEGQAVEEETISPQRAEYLDLKRGSARGVQGPGWWMQRVAQRRLDLRQDSEQHSSLGRKVVREIPRADTHLRGDA